MNTDIWNLVDKHISEGKYDLIIELLENTIIKSGVSEFRPLVGMKIKNWRTWTLSKINRFINTSQSNFDVACIYIEMNGFDINYDCWYFDLFAYDSYPTKSNNYDWLCDWHSDEWPQITIKGVKQAQKVFEWYHENNIWKLNPELEETYNVAMLLVMCNFIRYIHQLVNSGELSKKIPVLVTAHGFESIGIISL